MPSKVNFSYADIIAVDIFLELYRTRLYVGLLQKKEEQFYFQYDDAYLKARNVMSLGPEFTRTQKEFFSKAMFPSLMDRIPDPENPAYPSYCQMFGMPANVQDPLVLLATIGRRGPSSFIFEPVYEKDFTFADFDKFRQGLGLTLHDAALLFDVSLSSLQKIKSGESSGKDVLKRLEIYYLFPDVLKFQIKQNGKFLHRDKLVYIFNLLAKEK
ncbi:MAG: HipA N-terminal domain-containing protein [Alphaproteobacteria bacterium]